MGLASRWTAAASVVPLIVAFTLSAGQTPAPETAALNASQSRYADGEFRLDDSAVGANGSEILISNNPQMTNAQQLLLPSGTNALRLAPRARPREPFYWTVRALPAAPVAQPSGTPNVSADIAVLDPKPGVTLPNRAIDDQGKILFRWTRVPRANAYQVKLSPADHSQSIKIEVTGFNANPFELVNGHSEPREPYVRAKIDVAKEKYEISIEAYTDKDFKELVATSSPVSFSIEPGVFSRLAKNHVSLQRSFTIEESEATRKQPATFGLLDESGSPRTYTTEFAIVWKGETSHTSPAVFTPKVSLEARLNSNGRNKNNDAIRARIGEDIDYRGEKFSSWTAASLKYETSRAKSTAKGLAEIIFAPIFGDIGKDIGPDPKRPDYTGVIPIDQRQQYTYSYQPFAGIEMGDNIRVGTSNEKKGFLLRLLAKLRVSVSMDALAAQLGLRAVNLFCEETFRYLPLEDSSRAHNFVASGLDFFLTDDVSLSIRYNIGQDAPTFQQSRSFSTNIGLRF